MAETIPVTFPLAAFEYRGTFRDPIFELWANPDKAFQKKLYRALVPWGQTLENVSYKLESKSAAENHIVFNLPANRITVMIGLGVVSLGVNNPDWSQANTALGIGAAVLDVLKAHDVSLESQQTTLAMHLTPKGKTAKDITRVFLNIPSVSAKFIGEPANLGFSVYGSDASWVIDASVPYADSLFVRLLRKYGGEVTLPEILGMLDAEEKAVLEMLGVHEDASS
jgi:hypothetical protein